MQTSLLATKFYIPSSRQQLVPRPRLVSHLDEGLQRKFSLISAPAGFGKTTLVAQWCRQSEGVLAWLSLDERDNDLAGFLSYLLGGLGRAFDTGEVGQAAQRILKAGQPPSAEAVLTSLINDLSNLESKIIYVLDDYHVIEREAVHQALEFFIEHLPPQVHMVMTTRVDPPLPLARMRARNQLTELRARDLRFSPAESADFLNHAMGLQLAEEDVVALESRTEGWIAGLQLAAVSMQGLEDTASFIQSFSGSHRYILDYLIEEVLAQQSETVQNFMLQTAILDHLSGALCDAVTGTSGGQEILETLEQANLFVVPLDNERHWYRYHHLFADLLRERLQQTQAGQVKVLQIRASDWYYQNGLSNEAIEYALRAEDYERAVELIEEVAEEVWLRGVDTKLRHWLSAVPENAICTKPQLCIFHAWYSLSAGKQETAEQLLDATEKKLNEAYETVNVGKHHIPSRSDLRGRIATTRAFLASYRGETEKIIQYASEALEYLPDEHTSWRGTAVNVLGDGYDFTGEMKKAYECRLDALESCKATGIDFIIRIANLKLAIAQRLRGELQHVKEICAEELQLAQESGMEQTLVVGWLLMILAETLAEHNELEEANQLVKKGLTIAEKGSEVSMLTSSYIFSLRVLFSSGAFDEAGEIIKKLQQTARVHDVPPWIIHMNEAWKARIMLAQGKMDAVSRWCAERGLDAEADLLYVEEAENLALARFLIAMGQEQDALALLQRLLITAKAGDRVSRAIEMLILQAEAWQRQNKLQFAMDALEEALALGEYGKFIRVFVDEGAPVEALLKKTRPEDERIKDYVNTLLGAFSSKVSAAAQAAANGLIEPLSDREIEVLQKIAEGLTNQEIANRLYLSLNTVKVHTRNIYGKLGVNNRTQAVARAREIGILFNK